MSMIKVTIIGCLNRFNTVDMVIYQLVFNKIVLFSAGDLSEELMPDEPLIAIVIAKQFGAGQEKDPRALKPNFCFTAVDLLQDRHGTHSAVAVSADA